MPKVLRRWDESKHPRGRDGKFITLGETVDIDMGFTGRGSVSGFNRDRNTVTVRTPAGRVEVDPVRLSKPKDDPTALRNRPLSELRAKPLSELVTLRSQAKRAGDTKTERRLDNAILSKRAEPTSSSGRGATARLDPSSASRVTATSREEYKAELRGYLDQQSPKAGEHVIATKSARRGQWLYKAGAVLALSATLAGGSLGYGTSASNPARPSQDLPPDLASGQSFAGRDKGSNGRDVIRLPGRTFVL